MDDAPVLQLDMFLPYRLLVVTNQVTRVFAYRYKKEFGISIPESRVINALGMSSPLSSWEIGERTAMTKSRVSVAINNLVNRGMVSKKPDPDDQRLLQVNLTRKGDQMRQRIAVIALEIEQQLTGGQGSPRWQQLMELLDQVGQQAAGLPSAADD